jgi:hypothetical protein
MVPPIKPENFSRTHFGKATFFSTRNNRALSVHQNKYEQTTIPDLNQTKEQHFAALGSTLLSTAAERD